MPQSPPNAIEPVTAPIIVTAEMSAADQAWADGLRKRHYPPDRNQLAAHITLLHHLAPSQQEELQTLLKAITSGERPSARMVGVYSLGNGVALNVQSPGLIDIWSHIAERFERYLTPQDRHRPRLHVTIQNKVSAEIARATLAELVQTIDPRPIQITAIACWHYRGGPWSPISRHAFRR